MQTSSAMSAATTAEPLFATVTFVAEDDTPGSTFRVPIVESTTVRRLAKDAVQRLVLSRRHLDHSHHAPALVVTEVYVGGTDAQPKAEVFTQDCVVHVVSVRKEVVYMRLKPLESSAAPSRPTSPPPPPLVQPNEARAPAASAGGVACGAEQLAASTAAGAVVTATVKHQTGSAPARAAAEEHVDVEAEAPVSRLGEVPQVNDVLAEMATSAVVKPARAARTAFTTAAAVERKRSRAEPAVSSATADENVHCTVSHNDRGLGCGPKASKHFADNTVSPPAKLPRVRRAQQHAGSACAGGAAMAAAPPKKAAVAPVSRTLTYPPTAAEEEGRTTVGHVVADATVVEETSPPVEIPKGWGKESLKFFDPNTYCDDPRKAHLLPNMDYSRARRHRRPTTP